MTQPKITNIEWEYVGRKDLEYAWEQQVKLQNDMRQFTELHEMDDEERIQFIKDMVLAMQAELFEAMNEVGWKPWAKSRHIDRVAFVSELVDTFQFFVNVCAAVDVTPEELTEKVVKKHVINRSRMAAGYSGTEKCFKCKRALDDVHVRCNGTVCFYRG